MHLISAMKHFIKLFFLIVSCSSFAQSYKITFQPQKAIEGTYYLAQHFRDKTIILDSAELKANAITFAGKNIEGGVYVLLNGSKKKMFDFMVDDSRKFTISYDEKYSNGGMKVKGSQANSLMYEYMAKLDWARKESKSIDSLRKVDPTLADSRRKDLGQLMDKYQNDYEAKYQKYRFTRLLNMFKNIDVPQEIPANAKDTNLRDWQAAYYRNHYWDNVDFSDHSLIYTPQLFDKMNLFFFGLLYYQDPDTITRCADRVLSKIEKDSTMLRYFLDFITPKYERATKNIGWDQVFVNLVQNYYLQDKCPWATEADKYSKRRTVNFLSQSLIGAIGQELLMADTNQSLDAKDWISSHRIPKRYVILWFWDPDCHHCQEQSAELAKLVDSLDAIGNKPFEVYAVGYEADVAKWKKYVREHHFPFINVGGSNVNIDYQEAYNVHGAPTMIILDADRRIIMNKVIPSKSILGFLENYEKEHPDRATKITPWMRAR